MCTHKMKMKYESTHELRPLREHALMRKRVQQRAPRARPRPWGVEVQSYPPTNCVEERVSLRECGSARGAHGLRLW
jgi:hypothetical protein